MTIERKPKVHPLVADQNIDANKKIGFPSIWRSKQNKTTRPKILPVKKTFWQVFGHQRDGPRWSAMDVKSETGTQGLCW